ncbi:hypothetical protein EK904_010428 [Melospiza melodia maxima]|nr:hypothetical protein EK904_010428 [Melospiza melodia maxima]
MQAESGIVPDFEVGEEFHEEPKTYYELKSQPLKSRNPPFHLNTLRSSTLLSIRSLLRVYRVCHQVCRKPVSIFTF